MKKNILKESILCVSLLLFLNGCMTNSGLEKEQKDKEESARLLKYQELAKEERKKLYEYIKSVTDKALEIQKERKEVENALVLPKLDADAIREAQWQSSYIPIGMEKIIPVSNWKSPPEPLIKTFADYSHYELQFINKRPPIEKIVSIDNSGDKNIKNLIDDVERQSQGYIKTIKIMEDIKLIIVEYQEY